MDSSETKGSIAQEIQRPYPFDGEKLTPAVVECRRRCNDELPISKIHFDVLTTIFRFAQYAADPHSIPFEIRARRVSYNWHQVITTSSIFWVNISLQIGRAQYDPDADESTLPQTWWKGHKVLNLYLANSASRPLNIRLRFPGWEEYLALLVPHAHRWQRLSLGSYTRSDDGSELRQLLSGVEVPLLKSFYLAIQPCYLDLSPLETQPAATPNIFTSGAPALTSVTLFLLSHFSWVPPLQFLTTLSFTCQLTVTTLCDILSNSPRVSKLSVNSVDMHADNHFPSLLIPLRFLKHLRIESNPELAWWTRHTILPQLDTVELIYAWGQLPLPGFPSFSSVRSLIIRDCFPHPFDVIGKQIVSCFPCIQTLTVDEGKDTTGIRAGWYDDEIEGGFVPFLGCLGFSLGPEEADVQTTTSVPWPELQTLVLERADCLLHVDREQVAQDLRARAQSGKGISTIVVPRGMRVSHPEYWELFAGLSEIKEHEDDVEESWAEE